MKLINQCDECVSYRLNWTDEELETDGDCSNNQNIESNKPCLMFQTNEGEGNAHV